MSHGEQLMLYGLMVLVPWALNAWAAKHDFGRYADAVYMAAVLCCVWIATNAVALFVGPPQSKALHPIVDLIALTIVAQSVLVHDKDGPMRWWKTVLGLLFVLQVSLHASFWLAWWRNDLSLETTIGKSVYSRYLWTNGLIWVCELVAAGWPGGRYVASRVVARVRSRGRLHRNAHGGGL